MTARKLRYQTSGLAMPLNRQSPSAQFMLIALAFLAVIASGCLSQQVGGDVSPQDEPVFSAYVPVANNSVPAASKLPSGTRLTLIKFHGASQCVSCTNLGTFANSTLEKNFRKELSAGTVKYLDINAEEDFLNPFVQKYRPDHASIYLLSEGAGGEKYEELTEAWYYTGDEAKYSQYLTGVLRNRLGG